jgi:hypothetical protein
MLESFAHNDGPLQLEAHTHGQFCGSFLLYNPFPPPHLLDFSGAQLRAIVTAGS